MTIIVSKQGSDIKRIEPTIFEQEEKLQKYIYDNPEVLALDDIKDEIKFLSFVKEFTVPSIGSIDLLAIDADGDIYIIETKLFKNPDKKLVVAQILNYAAFLKEDYTKDSFINKIKEKDPEFETKLNDFTDEEREKFFSNLKENFEKANFVFIVLMDSVPEKIKILLKFLNDKANLNILACELRHYKFDNYEILVPKIFHYKTVSSSEPQRKWNEDAFIKQAKEYLSAEKAIKLEKFINFLKEHCDEIKGGRGEKASLNFVFKKLSPTRSLFTLWADGRLTINFGWHKKYAEKIKKALEKALPDYKFPNDYYKKWLTIPFNSWSKNMEQICTSIISLTK